MPAPTPAPGQIFRSPLGQAMLYVRTEQRPGTKQPEHLFVGVNQRMMFAHWSASVPEEWELVNDHDGRRQANEKAWELHVAEHERGVALSLVKRACSWLPHGKVEELREAWRQSRP